MAVEGESAHTEVPSEGHGVFPPFARETFASQVFWLALIFAAIYFLMARIALPRIGSIMEQRRQRIDGDLAEAERLKREADEAVAAYEKSLADARGRAQALANESRQQHAAAAEVRRKALDAELNVRIAKAEEAISASKVAAMANTRSIAIDAAAAIVERLTGPPPASQ